LRFCAQHKIAVTGFSSFGGSSYTEIGMAKPEDSCLENATIKEIATVAGKTPAQVTLRWAVQRGTAVIPKTSNADRLKENAALFDWTLSEDQMASINKLN
jgi:D-xylose reductase